MILKPRDVLEKLSHERRCKRNISVIFFLSEKKEIISIHRYIFFEEPQLKMNDIFIPAFYVAASFLILAQVKNGNTNQTKSLQPTQFEIDLTDKIVTAGVFLNIKLLDHLIITKKAYYSFHESGII